MPCGGVMCLAVLQILGLDFEVFGKVQRTSNC